VLLLNTDAREDFVYEAGDRIAQLLIVRVEAPDIVEVAELAETKRGEDGFGSTGT
jgi:dUTP pyrophosphatase